MLTKIMKFVAVGVLLMAVLPHPSATYQVVLEFVVCISGLLVLWEAARAGKYLWLVTFGVIAILFNPAVPVALSRKAFLWLDLACILIFLASLATLHVRPRLSMPSITNRTPGSESL